MVGKINGVRGNNGAEFGVERLPVLDQVTRTTGRGWDRSVVAYWPKSDT